MNPFMLSMLSLFARPLGQAVASALAAGSAAFVTWSVNAGLPVGTASTIAAGIAGAAAAFIQWGASTQGVNISVINNDPKNGLTVVSARAAQVAGIPKADAPVK